MIGECEDLARGKEPQEYYKAYILRKHNVTWKDRGGSGMNALCGAVQEDDRFIALTKFPVKVIGEWSEPLQTIVDSGGCENAINSRFARRAQMEIFRITAEEMVASSARMVNGSELSFEQYVLLPCKFDTFEEVVRFFLVDDLPRTLLLGCPFHYKYDAVARIRTGELRINELGVTLPLQRSNNTNEQFTTIATFECGTATEGGSSGHKELQSCSNRFSKMFEVFAE